MRDVLGYTYYRIARLLKGLNSWANKFYDMYTLAYMTICFFCNLTVLTILILKPLYHITNGDVINFYLRYIIIPVCLIFYFWLPDDDNGELYKKLEQKYKDDKHPKLKGWLIVIYFISSFVAVLLV